MGLIPPADEASGESDLYADNDNDSDEEWMTSQLYQQR